MSMDTESHNCNPEIWGGIECTINRVNDTYRDQLEMAGHYYRTGDIERFAALGIRKLRYPLLWEHHQPFQNSSIDWDWTENQLNLIKENRIEPIVGLLHHGSGPRFTNLSDEDFPQKFAAYAHKVAKKFPWLQLYTPVNEPLTTARFSGLYGLWYPHHMNELGFIKMLLNQLKGSVLAMQAIREINPNAQLIQTEDLSKTHSTELLKYQADFENERRWLTNDLLCGKVNRDHFFWNYLLELGIPVSSLEFFLKNITPPSILGYNYYVTSERFLDERVQNYPDCTHGTNKKHLYADTEAVRMGAHAGLSDLLEEAWQRYQLPMAITECHLSCTREEQLRWLKETWDTCCALAQQGIPLRAMTAWALLGAYDWNTLLTTHERHYESGVFDIRNNKMRMTLLGKMIHSLATGIPYHHPVMDEKGWWQKKIDKQSVISPAPKRISPLLIVGASGTLGNAFQKICEQRGISYIPLSRLDIDILDEQNIHSVIALHKPWAVINAAGYVKVDNAERDSANCFAVNTTAASLLAKACSQYSIRFMSFSSDLVFDGSKRLPYHEGDVVMPLNVYGHSKAEGERLILAEYSSSLIIRTSAFFGPWDKSNFVYKVREALRNGKKFSMASDVTVSPTYVPDLCHAAMDIFIDEESGIWHLSNEGMITWANFGQMIANRTGVGTHKLESKSVKEMDWVATRPLYSVLQSDKGISLPSINDALSRYFKQQAV